MKHDADKRAVDDHSSTVVLDETLSWKRFIKKLTRERAVPIISARMSIAQFWSWRGPARTARMTGPRQHLFPGPTVEQTLLYFHEVLHAFNAIDVVDELGGELFFSCVWRLAAQCNHTLVRGD